MGRGFRNKALWETVSRNKGSEWDTVSLWARFGNRVPEFDSRVGHTFPLSLFGKLRPGIGSQSGTRFPFGYALGNYVPESSFRMGCTFPNGPHREIASQNLSLEWDALSLWVHFGKLHPSSSVCSVTWFPLRASSGKCVPF